MLQQKKTKEIIKENGIRFSPETFRYIDTITENNIKDIIKRASKIIQAWKRKTISKEAIDLAYDQHRQSYIATTTERLINKLKMELDKEGDEIARQYGAGTQIDTRIPVKKTQWHGNHGTAGVETKSKKTNKKRETSHTIIRDIQRQNQSGWTHNSQNPKQTGRRRKSRDPAQIRPILVYSEIKKKGDKHFMEFKVFLCDVFTALNHIPSESIDCVVTSPPYWGLRNYGINGQIGLEEHPQQYIDKIIAVFREVKRVLKPSGSVWLNLGDSYFGSNCGYGQKAGQGSGIQNVEEQGYYATSENEPLYRKVKKSNWV